MIFFILFGVVFALTIIVVAPIVLGRGLLRMPPIERAVISTLIVVLLASALIIAFVSGCFH